MKNENVKAAPAKPNINVTPLIDVLLVLIIIFMVINPRREEQLPVKAPQPAPEGAAPAPETLMLTVSPDYQLALNTKPVGIDEIGVVLKTLMEQREAEARVLFIKAPAVLPYDSIVRLIDNARGSGVITIGLLTN
ncbi:MAG: biopolymer transporter ExbD [Acidobacteriota bacterium]